ncbi:MAG: acetate kinase [Candidatus Lambdaproteobacteria bacterium RIFOXYD1_FULL_56_27]|uniref:Acetate kinase n=1 Tax=Candidatus Lambdaproteobacteria bacterium RIFOXYD2_FULL_56_26 TaxID=1817773 RepID=A0A1F6H015_9PROT|nr:MAG: acetate kinase [Candidatus Lambdaproteobacteria bacterium RIFOXYC1_FULL_56_13]OGH03620.1 MAG: acetate kinase [Candidatus Lambdaproteobacteria bacterium RIFOXYD2_FULL_56_26]OGH06551.1 MAG: acetate kinase [Candidatus Lambdaproteobacteria bacterium RIFOXYD1_FULL_56_27]
MKTLVLNCGSSSIKYRLYDGETLLADGLAERIGESSGRLTYHGKGEAVEQTGPIQDHQSGMERVLQLLTHPKTGVLANKEDLTQIGHRVVHGGEAFQQPALITQAVLQAIKDCIPLAPLHNPANITGIEVATQVFPGAKQIAVFDTAFHQTLPEKAYRYALPEAHYQELRVRRYGFHGTSHKFVALEAAKVLGKPIEDLKLITLHLGNGSSMAAIAGGRSIDTTMGLTPLEGLVMGTRCGDLDPAIPGFLAEHLNLSLQQVDQLLNKNSGFKGLTGHNDLRTIVAKFEAGGEKEKLALELAAYRIKKYIGAYTAALGGLDALIFTAGIGEHSSLFRSLCVEGLEFLGLGLDLTKNQAPLHPDLSLTGSKAKILVIPTNEELMIVRECRSLA